MSKQIPQKHRAGPNNIEIISDGETTFFVVTECHPKNKFLQNSD
jgi:hypothetical protein